MKGRGFLASDTADGIPTRGSAVRKNMSFGSGKWRVTRLGLAAAAAGITLAVDAAQPALSQGTVIVGMTAGDVPLTTGNPDQGFEGFRFVGWSLYDSLSTWYCRSATSLRTSSRASRPNGISTRTIRSAGSTRCARASSGTTAATSPPTTWCGT